MTLNKKDFVEIDFKGTVKDGEVFDSTFKEDLEKMHVGHDHAIESKPFVFCLGEHMFLDALDDFLIGKPETEANYEIELEPEKAFGKRNPSLIQMVPMKVFRDHQMNPLPGIMLNFDGRVGKIVTVSGGRVMVDFNNPLAGKTVIYNITVKRKVTDMNEKIKSLNEFLFKRELNFSVEGKKLAIKAEKNMVKFIELFKDKFKEILDLDLEVKEVEKAVREEKKEK